MSAIAVSSIAFACIFGGALAGILLRAVLPTDHLSAESKDVVKLGMGLVGTMAALVLGLLVASAKGSFDTQSTELTQLSANIVLLDRVLAHYGPETQQARAQLRSVVGRMLDEMWSTNPADREPSAAGGEVIYDELQALAPQDATQHSMQAQAMQFATMIGQARWLMYAQRSIAVSMPLLIVLVLWLAIIFASFGLFAPSNATVIASLFVSALSVSGAILLILEMHSPYLGLIQISSAPLRGALAHLGL